MKPLRQSSIDDLPSLQMENELLMHEIRYLRARLTAAERKGATAPRAQRPAPMPTAATKPIATAAAKPIAAEATKPVAAEATKPPKPTKPTAAGAHPKPGTAAPKPESRAGNVAVEEKHRLAEEDLRWLLRRLDESPLGFLLRRKQGFRTLLSRYPHQP